MEAQELFTAIGNFGFPIVLSWCLLLRMEQRLDKLGDCLHELSSAVPLSRNRERTYCELIAAIARRAITGTILS